MEEAETRENELQTYYALLQRKMIEVGIPLQ
jgi:hypothetical protein